MSTLTDSDVTAGIPPVIRRRRKGLTRTLLPLGVAVLIVAIWQLASMLFGIPVYIVPAPSDVWGSLTTNWSMLLDNTWPTALESVLGFLVGNLVAILLAILFVHWSQPNAR